jgi:hypothetical protein
VLVCLQEVWQIFVKLCMRLIGRKSVICEASAFFGSRIIFAEFSSSKPWELSMNRLFRGAVMSSWIVSQQVLKKAHVKPSGPGALSDGMGSYCVFDLLLRERCL